LEEIFKAVKPKRVTEEIVEQMLELIAQGDLVPGQRLPSERQMAQTMGVSRPTLREALKRLEYAGLLNTVQGGGTYVMDVAGPSLRDPLLSLVRDSDGIAVELAEFRITIESWAASLAAQRAQPDELKQLRAIIKSMKSHLAAGQPLYHLDAEFHLCLAKATHNRIYIQVARTICDLYFGITRMSHENIFITQMDQQELMQEHIGIYEAIAKHDEAAARERMHSHLHRTEQWFREHMAESAGKKATAKKAKARKAI
jgi:GntR family transcriptional repressor for pyruvate dehydrogenase complex